MELFIGRQSFKVASLKKASETWRLYEDNECSEGRGGSRRMPTVLVYDDGGNRIARISYNGRVWDNNDNEIQLI